MKATRLLLLFALLPFAAQALGVSEVVRELPVGFVPGEPLTLTDRVTLSPLVGVYAVEEVVPVGWTVAAASHNGSFDVVQHKLRWGPFYDQTGRVLSAQLVPPADGAEPASFAGLASFDGQNVPVRGVDPLPRLRPSVTRQLPARFFPGLPLVVTWQVTRTSDVQAIALEDRVPVGWTVSAISDGGGFDAATHKVKWVLVGATATQFTLTATMLPPEGVLGTVQFTGVAAFDAWISAVQGPDESAGSLGDASRHLPEHYVPGVSFTLTNEVQVAANAGFYALEDSVPTGWIVGAISHGGVFDANLRKVKWGPFPDGTARQLTVELTPPASARGTVEFAGTVSLANDSRVIAGPAQLSPATSRVVRQLPAEYLPEQPLTVVLVATPAEFVRAWSVEDSVPAGWSVGALSDGGVVDALTHRLKWGPFFDAGSRTLTAELFPVPGAGGVVTFQGTAAFDGALGDVTGADSLNPAAGTARRELPAFFTPGTAVPLRLSVTAAGSEFYAVEEQLPAGWTASDPNEGGVFDAAARKLRWGPFTDRQARELMATLQPPASGPSLATFMGAASFDGTLVAISGADTSALLRAPRSGVPVAGADTVGRPSHNPARIPLAVLLANDHDPENDPLVLFTVDSHSAAGGTVYLDGAAAVYEPPASDPASDTFSYSVTDGLGGVATALVTVNVVLPNTAPVAGPDTVTRLNTSRVAKVLKGVLLANDTDAESDPLTIVAVGGATPAGATVTFVGNFVVYTAPATNSGNGSFTYTLSDGPGGHTVSATVTVLEAGAPATQGANAVSIVASGGNMLVTFIGVPLSPYRVQYSGDTAAPYTWREFAPPALFVAPANGVFTFADPSPVGPLRLYRAVAQ